MSNPLSTEEQSELAEFLGPTRMAVVATVGGDGRPQRIPNWYWYSDGQLLISTTKERIKYRNLSRDDRLAECIYSESLAAE